MNDNDSKCVAIFGNHSFVADGLAASLNTLNCTVDGFGRRHYSYKQNGIRNQSIANVFDLSTTSCEAEKYDVVVNYMLIKNGTVEENLLYLKNLLSFCNRKCVRHLIHISSVSVYPGDCHNVDESTPIESVASRKGKYGSLKVASDQYLFDNSPDELSISFVRPGFVLAPGLVDPIVGMAFRTPYNRLLLLGNGRNIVPITTRTIVNSVVSKLALSNPPLKSRSSYIVSDNNSPSRSQFLDFLCQSAGRGESVIIFPTFLWRTGAFAAGLTESALGTKYNIKKILNNACRVQRFDSSETSNLLGIDLTVDWKNEVLNSLSQNQATFDVQPPNDPPLKTLQSIGFIGFGRIVKQKYIPLLKRLGNPVVSAYDVKERQEGSLKITALTNAKVDIGDLYVVASPGPFHTSAIEHLKELDCPILVEKPLAYNEVDLDKWRRFQETRDATISVCHNYRYKTNVLAMWKYISTIAPGRIIHADLWFHSPPVSNESADWLRAERLSRTLLYDYAIHFLDVAMMFSNAAWRVDNVRSELNKLGETSLIQGQLGCDDYSLSFLLRQGSMPRRAKIRFVFENYDVHLNFFPDSFIASTSGPSPAILRKEANRLAAAGRTKILDKIWGIDSDDSHYRTIQVALSSSKNTPISVSRLVEFYKALYQLGDRVY